MSNIYNVTATQLPKRNITLQRNCYILCVGVNLKVVLSFICCLTFFHAQTLFWVQFFNLQLLLNSNNLKL